MFTLEFSYREALAVLLAIFIIFDVAAYKWYSKK